MFSAYRVQAHRNDLHRAIHGTSLTQTSNADLLKIHYPLPSPCHRAHAPSGPVSKFGNACRPWSSRWRPRAQKRFSLVRGRLRRAMCPCCSRLHILTRNSLLARLRYCKGRVACISCLVPRWCLPILSHFPRTVRLIGAFPLILIVIFVGRLLLFLR